jgi:Mce-associated membrane protein
MTKHSKDETVGEETTVTADAEQAESTAAEETSDAAEPESGASEATGGDEATETTDEAAETTEEPADEAEPDKPKRRVNWSRVFAFGVLPGLALVLALAAGFLKWQDNSNRDGDIARIKSPAAVSVHAAKDSTIALLSYKPDTVEQQLNAARDRLTGDFGDQYTSLINDVVIPGAKQKQISAVATVPAAASVSAKPNEAVVLVFVNQTVVVGQDAPTDTASSVRVTLEKVGDRWLISKFDPV